MIIINRGYGNGGRLGHGKDDDKLEPKKVETLAQEVIVDVSRGLFHTHAITATGSIYWWGIDVVELPHFIPKHSFKGVVCVSHGYDV